MLNQKLTIFINKIHFSFCKYHKQILSSETQLINKNIKDSYTLFWNLKQEEQIKIFQNTKMPSIIGSKFYKLILQDFINQQKQLKQQLSEINVSEYLQKVKLLYYLKNHMDKSQLTEFINMFQNIIQMNQQQFNYQQLLTIIKIIIQLQLPIEVEIRYSLQQQIFQFILNDRSLSNKEIIEFLKLFRDQEINQQFTKLINNLYYDINYSSNLCNQLDFLEICSQNQLSFYTNNLAFVIQNHITNIYCKLIFFQIIIEFQTFLKAVLLSDEKLQIQQIWIDVIPKISPTLVVLYFLKMKNIQEAKSYFVKHKSDIDERMNLIFQVVFDLSIERETIKQVELFHTLDHRLQIQLLSYLFESIQFSERNPFKQSQQNLLSNLYLNNSLYENKELNQTQLLLKSLQSIQQQIVLLVQQQKLSLKAFLRLVSLFNKYKMNIQEVNDIFYEKLNGIEDLYNPYSYNVIRKFLDFNYRENRILILSLRDTKLLDVYKQILYNKQSLINKITPFEAIKWLNLEGDSEFNYQINELISMILQSNWKIDQLFYQSIFEFIVTRHHVKDELIDSFIQKIKESKEMVQWKNLKRFNQQRLNYLKNCINVIS